MVGEGARARSPRSGYAHSALTSSDEKNTGRFRYHRPLAPCRGDVCHGGVQNRYRFDARNVHPDRTRYRVVRRAPGRHLSRSSSFRRLGGERKTTAFRAWRQIWDRPIRRLPGVSRSGGRWKCRGEQDHPAAARCNATLQRRNLFHCPRGLRVEFCSRDQGRENQRGRARQRHRAHDVDTLSSDVQRPASRVESDILQQRRCSREAHHR